MPYKLFSVRKDGSIGPLFINRKQKIPLNKWVRAESHPTEGFKFNPGWHVVEKPVAPHLSLRRRAWYIVQIKKKKVLQKPECQGGKWFLAEYMKVVRKYNGKAVNFEKRVDITRN